MSYCKNNLKYLLETNEIENYCFFCYCYTYFVNLFPGSKKVEEEETLGNLKKELELDVHKITVEDLCRRLGKEIILSAIQMYI